MRQRDLRAIKQPPSILNRSPTTPPDALAPLPTRPLAFATLSLANGKNSANAIKLSVRSKRTSPITEMPAYLPAFHDHCFFGV